MHSEHEQLRVIRGQKKFKRRDIEKFYNAKHPKPKYAPNIDHIDFPQ